jgi:hypothetical protein
MLLLLHLLLLLLLPYTLENLFWSVPLKRILKLLIIPTVGITRWAGDRPVMADKLRGS